MHNTQHAIKMQVKREQALAKLQQARTLLDVLDGLVADATYTLESEGAYTQHGLGDSCSVVRDHIGELESLLVQYVN